MSVPSFELYASLGSPYVNCSLRHTDACLHTCRLDGTSDTSIDNGRQRPCRACPHHIRCWLAFCPDYGGTERPGTRALQNCEHRQRTSRRSLGASAPVLMRESAASSLANG